MSFYSNRGRYQKTRSIHWAWVLTLVVTLLLCILAGAMIVKMISDIRAKRLAGANATMPPYTLPTVETDPTDPDGTDPNDTEPTETEPLIFGELVLPETLELLTPVVSTSFRVEPKQFVSGLDGTDIEITFEKELPTEPGVHPVTLVFTSGDKRCTRVSAMYRFALAQTKTVDMSQGHTPSVQDFLTDESVEAYFVEEDVRLNHSGQVTLTMICAGLEYKVTYLVEEHIPPIATAQTVTAQAGTLPNPADLVTNIIDDSDVTVTWQTEPKLTVVGLMPVTVVLTDSYGNTTTVESQIDVIPNENAPQFTGLDVMKIQVGDTISYKTGVTVVDAQDGEVTFTVNSNGLNRDVAGTYIVYYSAEDSDGNVTIMPRTIIVQEIGQAVVEARAQEALASIITDGMTIDEKINAVWYYTLTHVSYVGSSDKSGIIPAAYEGFTTAQGDCYTYYAMNVVMLNMLGIDNVEVRRTGGKTNHWWNLVQFEDGLWYHVDSCPSRVWMDEVNKGKMTESDLVIYTNNPEVWDRRPNYYTYDHTLPQYEGLDIAP